LLLLLAAAFPICDPKRSGIEEDPRLPFHSEVENWTQKYAASQGLMGAYGYLFKPVMSSDLVHFDMAVFQDGVLGGMAGAIYRRWSKDDSAYDPEICAAMSHTRWLQIKRTYKLCGNDCSPKKGQPGYDPAC
jgi:hypothetical protein